MGQETRPHVAGTQRRLSGNAWRTSEPGTGQEILIVEDVVMNRFAQCATLTVMGLIVLMATVGFRVDPRYHAPLFPILRAVVEDLSFVSLACLFAAGVAAGLIFKDLNKWLAGFALLLGLPLAAIAEMLVDSSSHNLWPLEFAMYGVLTLAPTAGVAVARKVMTRTGILNNES
jgi:hypothetical protein